MINQHENQNTSDQGTQQTSLAGYRIANFLIFFSVAVGAGYLGLLCPLSAWAVYSDKSGSGSGYFIFGLLFLAFIPATPAGIVAGLLSLPKFHPVLKAIMSVVVGIALSWLLGWIMGELFFST